MSDIVETINVGVGKWKSVAVEGGKGNTSVPTKNNNPYSRPFNVKCYRCEEVGHNFNECPKHNTMKLVEKDDDFVVGMRCADLMGMTTMSRNSTLVW